MTRKTDAEVEAELGDDDPGAAELAAIRERPKIICKRCLRQHYEHDHSAIECTVYLTKLELLRTEAGKKAPWVPPGWNG